MVILAPNNLTKLDFNHRGTENTEFKQLKTNIL